MLEALGAAALVGASTQKPAALPRVFSVSLCLCACVCVAGVIDQTINSIVCVTGVLIQVPVFFASTC